MVRSFLLGVLVVAVLSGTATATAIPSDAESAGYNFAESPGCAPEVAGPSRPEVARPGALSAGEVLYGPWADFFGRTYAQVSGSTFRWTIFGTNETVRVHERLRPATELVDRALAEARADGRFYRIDTAYGWVWRTVGGARRISEHATATAVDLNPRRNPYSRRNVLVTDMPAWFVAAFSEAGFCWGGNWIQVKDAMHYSWSGPVLTPGYGPRPAPYPPVTDAAPFPPGTTVTTVLPDDPEASFFLADLSGDGAPDLVRVRPVGGGVRVEAAGSPSFDRIGFRADVPVPAGRELLMADHDGDGRADLWVLDDADGTLSVEVRSHRSRYREVIAAWSTAIPAADDYGLTHGDDDFAVDLVTLDRDGPATIWSQRSGFADPVTTLTPDRSGLGSVSWAPALGDWDVDGRTDLYLVVKGDPAEVRVVTATGSRTTIPLGGAVPVAARLLLADYDGDGRDDLYLLHDDRLEVRLGGARGSGESLTSWFESVNEVPWDAGPECPTGAVCASVGFVDDLGRWHLAEFPGADHDTDVFYYGNPDDVPFMGDWDCDGIDTPGLYRRSDGYVYLRDANTEGVADRSFYFGNPGDVPLVGDFDGDGCDTVSIYRPSEHRFYLVDRLGDGDEGLGEADRVFTFGDPGDVPFVGDFDGDGRDDVGLHRVSTGRVYLRLEQTDGVADVEFVYGDPGDTVVAGDWDGDGVDTVGVYRPSEGTWYLNLENRSGVADHVVHFHAHEPRETIPVVGSFRVGD